MKGINVLCLFQFWFSSLLLHSFLPFSISYAFFHRALDSGKILFSGGFRLYHKYHFKVLSIKLDDKKKNCCHSIISIDSLGKIYKACNS